MNNDILETGHCSLFHLIFIFLIPSFPHPNQAVLMYEFPD